MKLTLTTKLPSHKLDTIHATNNQARGLQARHHQPHHQIASLASSSRVIYSTTNKQPRLTCTTSHIHPMPSLHLSQPQHYLKLTSISIHQSKLPPSHIAQSDSSPSINQKNNSHHGSLRPPRYKHRSAGRFQSRYLNRETTTVQPSMAPQPLVPLFINRQQQPPSALPPSLTIYSSISVEFAQSPSRPATRATMAPPQVNQQQPVLYLKTRRAQLQDFHSNNPKFESGNKQINLNGRNESDRAKYRRTPGDLLDTPGDLL